MLALDDRILLLVGANFRAEILNNCALRDSQRLSYLGQVDNVGFDTVQTAFLFGLQGWHGIPKKKDVLKSH